MRKDLMACYAAPKGRKCSIAKLNRAHTSGSLSQVEFASPDLDQCKYISHDNLTTFATNVSLREQWSNRISFTWYPRLGKP